jgi:predicted NACHT family NTPase
MSRRDDFPVPTKKLLAQRVGYNCSNPSCYKPTIGPSKEETQTTNIGIAAHITAASPGGPRYNPSLSSEERKSQSNGIWLCQNCAKLIDSDPLKYTVDIIKKWKIDAEKKASDRLESNNIDNSLSSLLSSEYTIDELVQTVRSRIHDNIQSLHSTMPIWGIDSWVPLGDLFVDVNIHEELSCSSYLTLDHLWQDFMDRTRRYSIHPSLGQERKRISGIEILSKDTNLMVVGKPGSGKTTFLQGIVTECNAGNLEANRIPDLIKLRYFIDDGREFDYSLERYFEKRWQLSNTEINTIFNQGKSLILLDGLDEIIGEDAKKIVKEIKKFTRSYPQVKVIVSCRTQSFTGEMDWKSLSFSFVEIADFNDCQVRSFAEHWFKTVIADESSGLTQSHDFLNQLFLESNRTIRDLVVTPILLSLTCAVFHYNGKFHSNLSKLYKEALELLLERWDNSREIKRDGIYPNLSLERKLELLGYIAEKKFEQEQYVLFEQIEIERYIAEFLEIHERDSRTLLKNIESQHGLLIERSQNIWSFSHLTIQEYFVARQIVLKCNSLSENDPILNNLVSHTVDERWREIFLLVVSMLDNPDVLLHLIKFKIEKLVLRDEIIQQFLFWVYQKSQSVDEFYQPAVVRAFYFKHCDVSLSARIDKTIIDYINIDHINKIPCINLKGDLNIDSKLMEALDRVDLLNTNIQADPEGDPNQNIGLYYGSDGLFNVCIGYSELAPFPDLLKDIITELYQYDPHQEWKKFKQWWQTNGKNWSEKLKFFMIEYRNIGHDWQFTQEQYLLLKQYEDGNRLLLDCLNSNYNMSEKIKQEIYEFLLIPNIEIEKRLKKLI